ncbi:MAG: diadenylate cyclase CdaA [Bryobacterales bacterium]|nr:diadenylate cyclase CdaA [Bryobacteraceae bacterium]MDW8353803.1 diadenylate cyclase CdaA [Bryobacterales bacterium]
MSYAASFPALSPTAILDILIVSFLIYQFFLLVRGRRSAQLLAGVAVLLIIYLGSVYLRLELLRSVLSVVVPYTAFALIVLFQSEIRRALIRLGRRWTGFRGRLQQMEFADEILLALARLSQQKIGALIVIERDTGLRTFIESGVLLDAHLSRDLLLAIFQPGGALHDGAVIIQRDRIAAASCFLPLSMNPAISRKLGTRHRAAIGITEDTDCLSIVVSEETGRISVAAYGEIEQDVTLQRVDEIMAQHFGRRARSMVLPAAETAGDIPLNSEDTGWRRLRR